MTERLITFSTDMVNAVLDGRKTQTRRVIRPQPGCGIEDFYHRPDGLWMRLHLPRGIGVGIGNPIKCPYGQPGDRLWVRETWAGDKYQVVYKTDWSNGIRPNDSDKDGFDWKSPIIMPRWASRINLEITDIRVERLQEITEEDAKKEGVARLIAHDKDLGNYVNYLWHGQIGRTITRKQADGWKYQFSGYEKARDSFSSLRNSLAKKGEKWEDNPFVWVLMFRRRK